MKIQTSSHGAPRTPSSPGEDAWRVQQREGCLVAALADGMGSARLGGEAARRAVEMITDYLVGRPQGWSARRALIEFAARINRVLYMESQVQHGTPELMCTLSVVAIEGGMLYGLNVGDSPVFLRRRDSLVRLSEDHIVAEPGMEHVLTRALGASVDLEPHLFETSVDAGDIVLLCSDGVSRVLDDRILAGLLARRATARTLVAAAQDAVREHPERADDASAVVLEVIESGRHGGGFERLVEVAPALRPGDRVDDLTLVRPLQDGARIWEARRPDGSRVVAKFPSLDAAGDGARRDAFAHEAWQAARLESDDFVRGAIPTAGSLRYYTMEFVDAPTLREVLRDKPLAVEEAVALGAFLLRCGQALLEHDIVHGDIKPENILVLRAGDGAAARGGQGTRFKLLDLGSAAEVFSVTTRAGTPSYLAPERFRGAAAGERTELYAIGVTLYETLTRLYPYGEVERFQTPRFEHPPRRPTTLNPAVPPWLEAIVLRALSPDPARRYQAYSEMAFDLAHPAQVAPFYRKDAPLLERNPLLFYKALCLVLLLGNIALLIALTRR
ncbi:MAG: bifunctional protein-serine/threonine kinase/phosphatase [Opitutaceae bacterium]|nr:bifunctional protein-serine/threonine kinase/phosphatase [Opitutaceae bacterium]